MLSGQNREAVSDLEDAMKFLKNVYYEELNGYDGNNVHYILDILLAKENASVLKLSRATASCNKTDNYVTNCNSNINNSIIYALENSLKPMTENTYPNSEVVKTNQRDQQRDQSRIRQIRHLSDEKSRKSKDKPKEPIRAETFAPLYSRKKTISTERNRDFICYRLNSNESDLKQFPLILKSILRSFRVLTSPTSSILTNSNKRNNHIIHHVGKLGKYFSHFQKPLHFKRRHHNHLFRQFMKSKRSTTPPIPERQDGIKYTRKINSNTVDLVIFCLENDFFYTLKVIKIMKNLGSRGLQILF